MEYAAMTLFGRRGRQDEPSDTWDLARGVIDGHEVIARSKRTDPDPTRPVKVTVRIGFAEPDSRGWPGPADHDFLQDAEETLLTELSENGAELVLIVTGNRAREFIAYCPTYEWLEGWGPSVLSRWGTGRLGTGLDAVTEPDWATYRAMTGS